MTKPTPDTPLINRRQNEQFDRKHGAKKRAFAAGDSVYAEIHIRNDKYWAKGVVIERKGRVVYNVLLDDSRRRGLIRSHANQLRSRAAADEPEVQAKINLPLHVLLEEFGVNQPGVAADTDPVQEDPEEMPPEQPMVAEDLLPVPEEVMAVPGPSLPSNPVPEEEQAALEPSRPRYVCVPRRNENVPAPRPIDRKRRAEPASPGRGPSDRKRSLPSHFRHYELY